MTVDIRGTNTLNKGAQLMLEAAAERLSPHTSVSAPPIATDFDVRARLGLRQTLHEYRVPKVSRFLGNQLPGAIKRRFGLAADSDVGGVVDASGFAYSDSFGVDRIRREAVFGAGWKKRGVPIVLLPQALGPFKNPGVKTWSAQLIAQAELVFARDSESANYARSLGTTTEIQICPDFTIGLPPASIPRIVEGPYAAIVPNVRMIRPGILDRDTYLENLEMYVRAVRAEGLTPVLVAHQEGDHMLAKEMSRRSPIEIYAHSEPRSLKAAIGAADLVIGSRFHAVVGSLSQGVPTITLGWAHKYEHLHRDFEVPNWIADISDDPASRVSQVLADIDGVRRARDQKQLLLQRVDAMWERTYEVLGLG